jgi:hypothetical protein
MGKFSLVDLNEAESKAKYQFVVPNSFAALDNLKTERDINSIWEATRVNTRTSTNDSLGQYELKGPKAWFHEGCSKL